MLRRLLSFPGITGVVIALFGLAFIGLGTWLATLGGTFYYPLAGVALTASGIMIARRQAAGWWLYLLAFIATLAWAVYEVGFDGWQLLPRLLVPALLGLWCSMPFITRPVFPLRSDRRRATAAGVIYLAAILGIFGAGFHVTETRFVHNAAVAAPLPQTATFPDAQRNQWLYYGRNAAGERFSPLAQLTPANVGQLQPAWRYDTGDLPREGEDKDGREFNFEVTPIKIRDRLYLCTPHRRVIALNATTGKPIWSYDPHTDTAANEYLACRGVAYYAAPADTGQACARRIITTAGNAQMMALDADTGRPCDDFGDRGFVSLTDQMGDVPPGFHFITSQPLVVKDRVVLGGWIYDNQARGEPSGVVRAYDPVTGKLAWAWDMGRPDPTAPLKPGETYTRGTPNGWGTYTADTDLGLVYIPLGNATPDYYGAARRPFDNKYSSALVALDIETGKERWHFQTVHHDVWDFDLPIGPSLVDLPSPDGVGSVHALVQTTKMGQLFLLDRATGKPLAQVIEKPVPTQPLLPGDTLSPTQPDSVGMPNLSPADLKEQDMWGATPLDQLWCRIQFKRAIYHGQYTPPTLGTTIAYPAFDGVMDWYGASIDPARHLLIANTSYIPFTVETMPAAEAINKGLMKPWAGWGSKQPYPKPKDFSVGPQYGTPYAAVVKPWLTPLGAPCSAPPWGKLVAIDLQTRKIAWERPVGTTRDMNIFNTHTNAPLPTGIFSIGGNIITAGGLVFMGATADNYLRAFDEASGKQLWQARLPAGGQATPMTYLGGNGRQYVVIAAGGHGGLRTEPGDAIVAYALPKDAAR
ncbi:membrane-bound PQQ-dependent dehydrogenase, glucose/quinate/shikimate family [Sodalis sp. RH24]|uniref:membrane-bound PQQ-dependent dehydrogenase, glucose/quinate/shikimate family n=1 Tax=unclassified Sodalis (in: enterobacteria) TaxID=2636512 RepID=UPI0039B49763